MRKQAPFRHPIDIRQDDRIADLLATHGHTGYGVYWMILEILHSHETMQVEYCEKTIRRMAAQIGMKHEEFHEMLQDMIIDYDLFEVVDGDPAKGQHGYLRSTITYRRPRKPKTETTSPATTTLETELTIPALAETEPISTATITDTEIILSMPTSPYSPAKYIPTETDVEQIPSATFAGTNPTPSTDALADSRPETWSFEDFRFYTEMQEYIAHAAPRVAQLPLPFTRPQIADIRARFDEGLILDILEQMQQDDRLTINHASAYHAFLNIASIGTPHSPKQQKSSAKAAQAQRKGRTTTP